MSFRSNISVGYGKSHASFGEIVQGRLPSGDDFLITLPIDMWSICNLTAIERKGPLSINCRDYKSAQVAEMLLAKLDIESDYEITISFSRNIPVGKGLSSSTADMLSTVRALQEVYGFLLREKTISEMFKQVEPHDGLMYKSCVVYNHRKGQLIKELLYVPRFWVIAVDFGGQINTVEYNSKLEFTPDTLQEYQQLLADCDQAFAEKDDVKIAQIATRSTELNLMMNKNELKNEVFKSCRQFEPLGVVNTHSGTCFGLVFPMSMKAEEIDAMAHKIEAEYKLPVFFTKTLKLLI